MLRTNEYGLSRILLIIGGVLLLTLFVIAGFMLSGKKVPLLQKSNQSSSQYLTITEWGVRLPLSEGNRDMYYTLFNIQGGVGQGVRIYSKDIDDATNSNGKSCKNANYPLFVMTRVSAGRGQQMNTTTLPDYDGNGGPFKTYDFQTNYAFGGVHDDNIAAPCINVGGTGDSYKADASLAAKYKAKIDAIRTGYYHLEGVPTSNKTSK